MESNADIIFLVGLGASAELYSVFLQTLQKQFPQKSITVIEWWKEADLGMSKLHQSLQDNKAILIGHSGGGMMTLRAFAKWSDKIERVIALDTHQLHHASTLPSVTLLLDVALAGCDENIKSMVKKDYSPIINNDKIFRDVFTNMVEWVNNDFESTCTKIKSAPPHFALHVGFTDATFKILTTDDATKIEQELWGKYGMDIKVMPMHHFDFIAEPAVDALSQHILNWLYNK